VAFMRLGLRAKLIIAFGFLMLTSIGNFGFLWMAERNAAEQQLRVTHTHQVIASSDSLLGHLRDTETGQRGFLLTGRSEYLEPYNTGIANSKENIHTLFDLTRDNPAQQLHLTAIEEEMKNKLAELEDTISLARQDKRSQALVIVNSGEGKRIMDTLRALLMEFKAEENRLLKLRSDSFSAEQKAMRVLFVVEAIFLAVLIAGIAWILQKHLVAPVLQLTRNAERLAAGNEPEAIQISSVLGRDEVAQLVQAFDDMVQTINTTLGHLIQAKKETEEKELRLSEIIESTNVGTWEWNIQTDEVIQNDRCTEMLGYTPNELEPVHKETRLNLCHPEDLPHYQTQMEKHFSGEQKFFRSETRRRHKNGKWVWVMENGKVVERADDNTPLRMSGISADISVRKETERAKSEFVSTVSHELRTPLTSIKGSLGLVRAGTFGELPEKLQSVLDIAVTNTERLVLLINDLLDMEKINSGNMTFNMESIDIASLIEEAIAANEGYGTEYGISFVFENTDSGLQVLGDKSRLTQVLSNLMSNAAKFSPKGEQVKLSAVRRGDTVSISVEDKGVGIPKDFRDSLFEKFTQADSSDTRQKGGTGLGLSITKAIIDEHGGSINFTSKEGKGSTFFVTLPVSS